MLRLAISSCLFGESVRYDGGHKHDAALLAAFGPLVEWIPVCPEVECGMGTPREPVRLIRASGVLQMVGVSSGVDHTPRMTSFARERAERLAAAGISGYVLKKNSPSCGVRVAIADAGGGSATVGRGLFVELLLSRLPGLPVADEDRLSDERLRERFLAQAHAYQARMLTSRPSPTSR